MIERRSIGAKASDELIERLDDLAKKLARPGRGVIRSDAVRAALIVGLDCIEADPSVIGLPKPEAKTRSKR